MKAKVKAKPAKLTKTQINFRRYQRMYARGTPKMRKRLQHEKDYSRPRIVGCVTPKEATIFRGLIAMQVRNG
jgi:hypothetical protein